MAELTPSRVSSGRTPQDRQLYRKSCYKQDRTSNWKDTYRQRCSTRLKRDRKKLIDHNRNTSQNGHVRSQEEMMDCVYDVMQQEWEQLRSEINLPHLILRGNKRRASSPVDVTNKRSIPIEQHHSMCLDSPSNISSLQEYHYKDDYEYCEKDIEEILSLMDEITQELITEEKSMISCYEENLEFTERALSAVIDSMNDDNVVCPICLKNILMQDQQIIFCSCGIRIDTEQDGITLDYVRRQLTEGTTLHSQYCSSVPQFTLDQILGIQNILMTCTVCDFMYIIV